MRGFRTPGADGLAAGPTRHTSSHDVYDHTSVLKMIEWRWGLTPLTPRDAAARNIAEVLDFGSAPNLAAPRWSVPPAVSVPCGPEGYGRLHGLAGPEGAGGGRTAGAWAEWSDLGSLGRDIPHPKAVDVFAIIGFLVFGLVVGAVARLIKPGQAEPQPR